MPTTRTLHPAAPTGAMHRAWRLAARSLRIAWTLGCVMVIVVAVGVAVAWKGFGYAPVAVRTGSMSPTLPVHALLFVHDVPAGDVRVGDIITFDPPGPVPRTTHRVVQRELRAGRWYFRTKGDGNRAADDWRASSTIGAPANETYLRGVSYANGTAIRTEAHVKHVGWLAELARVPHLRTVLVSLPFLLLGIQALLWIWSPRPSGMAADRVSPGEQTTARSTP